MADGIWRLDDTEHVIERLIVRAGLSRREAEAVIDELGDQLVATLYYVPTNDELYRDYHRLGMVYLRGQINVRWVMCRETHDALWHRHRHTQYSVMPDVTMWLAEGPSAEEILPRVRTIMEMGRRWNDPGMLFGIPIRIDPIARSPVWEMV